MRIRSSNGNIDFYDEVHHRHVLQFQHFEYDGREQPWTDTEIKIPDDLEPEDYKKLVDDLNAVSGSKVSCDGTWRIIERVVFERGVPE